MTYAEFKTLTKVSQVDITLDVGVIIGKRTEHGDLLKLFHMGAFYVELRYLENQTEIIAVYYSGTDELLEPYLTAIDITGLFAN